MAIPTVAPIKPTPKVGDTWDVPVRSTRSRVPVRILGFLAGALIALPVLALIAVGPVPFDQVRSALTLPDELRSAALISDTGTTSSVHRIGWWFYREVAATGHQYASVALFKDGGIAAIALEPSGEAMLEIDGQRIGALPASSTGLTVAPDGTKLGVMYIPDYESPAQLPENVTDTEPTLWQIGVFRIPSATFSPAGKGYAPFFMDDANLARAVPAGVTMLTIPTGEMHQLIDEDLVSTIPGSLVSPDRTHIALSDAAKNRTLIYRVAGDILEFEFSVRGAFPSAALGNDALYELRQTDASTEVWRYGLDKSEPTVIHRFPASLHITRMAL